MTGNLCSVQCAYGWHMLLLNSTVPWYSVHFGASTGEEQLDRGPGPEVCFPAHPGETCLSCWIMSYRLESVTEPFEAWKTHIQQATDVLTAYALQTIDVRDNMMTGRPFDVLQYYPLLQRVQLSNNLVRPDIAPVDSQLSTLAHFPVLRQLACITSDVPLLCSLKGPYLCNGIQT